MITYVDFSLFESPAKVLVNTVNTVGVMGKGIAKNFKGIYPEMFSRYQQLCERGTLGIGDLWLYKTPQKWVLNFPTKRHWKNPSKTEYIEQGLEKFVQIYWEARVTSISFPQLGCGNGELDWASQVKPLMERYLKSLPIEIFVHLTSSHAASKPERRVSAAMKLWLRAEPQSLAFTEVWDDLIAAIGSGIQLSTLDKQDIFTAEIFSDKDGGGVSVTTKNQETILFYREQLLDLWQYIRSVGVTMPDRLPSGLDWHARYVVPILSKLPYLEEAPHAKEDTNLNKRAVGLLFQPSKVPRTVARQQTSVDVSFKQMQMV